MKNRFTTLLFTSLMAVAMLSSPVMAQTNEPDPGHPRINEVDQRLENQQNRVNNGVHDGQINGRQAARDEHRDARVQHQMSRDEAKHGGHITKREQHHLNHELNHNSHDIHHQRHPAHHEVK